jgi:hypothetical protein
MVHITLQDLLEIEHRFPGLTGDIDTCIWQVLLIKQQVEATNG